MGCPRSLSGFDHLFDFIIPRSRNQPERIIKTINNQGRNTAQAVAFAWIDVKEARPLIQKPMPSKTTANARFLETFSMR